MRDCTSRQFLGRLFTAWVLLLFPLFIAGWMGASLTAQDKAKPKKEEEEDPGAKPKRPVPVVGDEDREEQTTRPAAKPVDTQVADLRREAERAKNPAVKDLFNSLAIPHDMLVTPTGRSFRVEPFPKYIGPNPNFSGSISLKLLNDQGKPGRTNTYEKRDLKAVDPYENIALNKVNEFLKKGLNKEPENDPKFLSERDMFEEAEKVLTAVIKFHESARERGLREGDEWKTLGKNLHAKLRDVQVKKLQSLTDARDWETAYDLALRLRENYHDDQGVQQAIAKHVAQYALQALHAKNYGETQKRLLLIDKDFQSSEAAESVREGLKQKAAELLAEAKKRAESDPQGAIDLLQTARTIYAQLPGLQDLYLQLNKKYPVIYVGVHGLPENLSPATAYTDSEKQAVELLYESLVKLSFTPSLGQRYEAGLAQDLPELVPLGRRFQLIGNAFWSDGKRLTGVDVRHTVGLLSSRDFPGRIPEWAYLIEQGARTGGSQLEITLTLRQGYLDPLALMDFKILPQKLQRADDPDFAHNPIGSGPYKYDAEKSKPGEEVVFVANSHYEERPGKLGQPRIREIHFVVSRDPANDFQHGKLQLLLNLPTSQLRATQTLPDVQTYTVRNRRIYFLAVNHRQPPLRENIALRRAIAHAINREEILDQKFRSKFQNYHRVLNGPYPPDSWAYWNKPDLKSDPYNPKLADSQAKAAHLERKLSLKYPEGDADVAGACEMIRAQLEKVNINVELKALPSRDLRRDVEERHDYELAYYHWDYPNEEYWLWPLFDPRATGPGGLNFLGYENDDKLASYFRQAMTRREFSAIQELTHNIHYEFYEKMPLIPLWQLDTHYAVHRSLAVPMGPAEPLIDPLLVFTDVEKWKKEQ
jgi:ABC-type transport system substrate-binding protein